MDVGDFRELVVRPALKHLATAADVPRLWSEAAENLVVGTAAHESGGFKYLWQRKANGVRLIHERAGRGLFQIQPDTHRDLWRTYLRFRPAMRAALTALASANRLANLELVGNLPYAAAVCRLIYWRKRPPLPPADDIEGLGRYWKDHYNTTQGGGTVARFVSDYRRYVAPSAEAAASAAKAGKE